jgi:hypothetical protein
MKRGDFNEVVNRAWNSSGGEGCAMDTWQTKIRNFRRMVRCWVSNVVVESVEFNWFHLESENRDLDDEEKNRMKQLARELERFWALEEIKANQRSRDRIIIEGDMNTAYFHAIASQMMRKKRIECLQGLLVGCMIHKKS